MAPIPRAAGAQAAARALALAQARRSRGGAHLRWRLGAVAPPARRGIDGVRATTRLLLASGVPISGVNTVRKRLSRISGGRLAMAAAPATALALVLSDVGVGLRAGS